MLFDPDWVTATNICKLYPTKNLEYFCVGGVYMSASSMPKRNALTDCSKSDYPASCFRAFHRYFNSAIFPNTTPCKMDDRFVRRGCIWAEGTNAGKVSICDKYNPKTNYDVIDEHDYLVCLDGVITFIINEENKNEICPVWANPDIRYPPETAMICSAKVGEYKGERYPPYLFEWLEELKPTQ